MEDELCEYLTWDSDFFELRIGRLKRSRLTPETARAAEKWARTHRIDCFYFLAALDDADTVRLAEEGCYRLTDVRITLEVSLKAPEPAPTANYPLIRLFEPADATALRKLASISHTDSRFYFDRQFSREACARLYETWIQKSWENPEAAVFVADNGSGAVGYATATRTSDTEGSLGLLAVDPGAQGMGLGRQLSAAVLAWGRDEGLTVMRVITQGRNLRALRMYSRCGFEVCVLRAWYHRWFSYPII